MNGEDDIFSRQIKHFGPEKQRIIQHGTILVAGAGGIGCAVAEILVRCGLGHCILIDNSVVDPPDLSRQSLYAIHDVGSPKAYAAARKLETLTGKSTITPVKATIGDADISRFIEKSDCIIDCLDNFTARFALEEAQPRETLLIHVALQAGFGQVGSFVKGLTVSLNNLYKGIAQPDPPIPASAPLVYCLSSLAAQEALNALWGRPLLVGKLKLIHMDGLSFHEQELTPE